MIKHKPKIILHCDCNNYYASIESLLKPELRDVPMAVAGNPENRHGIILSKNDLAKAAGVKTAETIIEAKKNVLIWFVFNLITNYTLNILIK